jgi:hypothetical protein
MPSGDDADGLGAGSVAALAWGAALASGWGAALASGWAAVLASGWAALSVAGAAGSEAQPHVRSAKVTRRLERGGFIGDVSGRVCSGVDTVGGGATFLDERTSPEPSGWVWGSPSRKT